MVPKRRFTKEFKLSVIHELESGRSIAQLSREHDICASLLYKWKIAHISYKDKAFSGKGNAYTLEAKLAEKDRLIGKLYAENDFLKKALGTLEARLAEARIQGGQS